MSKNKVLVVGEGIVVVALLAVGYFVAAPKYQVNSYKKTAEAKHNELHGKLDKVIAVQEADMFVQYDPSPSTIRNDVEAGNKAAKEAEATLNTVSKELTAFAKLPLTEWAGGYDGAQKLQKEEETYIKTAQELIAETKALLAFMDKFATVAEKSDEFDASLHKTNRAQTAEEYAAAINGAVKFVESAVGEMEKFEAPESIKEMHLHSIKSAREAVELYSHTADAVEAGDVEKSMDLGDKLFEKGKETVKKSDELNASFVRDSKVRKTSDRLSGQDRNIVGLLAAL